MAEPWLRIRVAPSVAVTAWICATLIVVAVIAAVALPWETWGTCHCQPVPAEKAGSR